MTGRAAADIYNFPFEFRCRCATGTELYEPESKQH